MSEKKLKKTKKTNVTLPIKRYYPTEDFGLTQEQVNSRIKSGLVNKTKKSYSKSYLNILFENIFTFFNLLGLIVVIALILVDAQLSNFFFVVIYIANISIGIIQEIKAKRCIDKLSIISNKSCKILRNGKLHEYSSEEIVLDDVIYLGLGNQVPTDCIILSGNIEVNESLLTGESIPVKKGAGETLLAGSFIVSGTCYVKAEKIGKDNYVEQLSAKAKKYKAPQSELISSLRFIIKIIACIIVPMAISFIIKAAMHDNFNLSATVLGTSTVIIGMIPSGMFLLTSVALAIGIIKLYKHNTLVQDLYSLEMLARVDTICFDKTGTITDGQMCVKELIKIDQSFELDQNKIISSMLGNLTDTNQTAIALHNHFGQETFFNASYTLPFNSDRKFSAVTFRDIGTFAFGAPEFLLSKESYNKIHGLVNEHARKGLRVLLFAKTDKELIDNFIPNDFKAISIILLQDNIREDAIETIRWFKENNVSIKVISGDNPITVSEVSKRVGIDNADKFISLETLSDQEVYEIADNYTVFGRVSPEQKAILLKALKAKGHVTAMTGDGVNDILALKEADCAISVASGSDAARNISHLVLMDNNFNSMPKVVYEGRRVINNVQSSASLFLMKTLFTMFMGLTMLILPHMETYPFTLSQMIMLEVFVIGLPSFFLSLQPNDARVEGKFIKQVLSRSIPSALLMIWGVVITEACRLFINIFPSEIYTSMGVYALTIAGVISLFNICRPLNKYRTFLFLFNFAIVITIVCIGLFRGFPTFQLASLLPISTYWHHLLIMLGIFISDFPILLLLKKIFSKK